MAVKPGALMSDGVRLARMLPSTERRTGCQRTLSGTRPGEDAKTPTGIDGSSATQDGADHRTRRDAAVVDPRKIDVGDRVAIDVHAHLDHARELHEVDHRLAVCVALRDGPEARRRRVGSLHRPDNVVVVLIDAPAGVWNRRAR